MTVTMAKLITELALHGRAESEASKWVVRPSGATFQQKSIEAAYDRFLIRVVTESGHRHRPKQWAELTEIGEFAAEGLRARRVSEQQPVSEAASLMITEALLPT